MCSATDGGGAGSWQMWAISGTTSDAPAARKSRARETSSVSAGRISMPDVTAAFPARLAGRPRSGPWVVTGDGAGHAAGSAAAANELAPLEGDDRTLAVGNALLSGEEGNRRNDLEAHALHLPERSLVSRVRQHEPGTHRREVAPGRPLLALLHDATLPAAGDRLHRRAALAQGREHARHLLQLRLSLAPEENRQSFGSNEVRWIHHAQLAIDLREDHVEVDRRVLLRHDHDDDVLRSSVLEEQARKLVDRGRTRTLAEADHDEVLADRMDVPALKGVVQAPFDGAVVEYPFVLQERVIHEEPLHDQLLRPPHPVAHRPDHDVPIDPHRHVP